VSAPIAYLVRVGSVDKTFPFLSDPSLSIQGLQQADEVREFFLASGMGQVRSVITAAALQFAERISIGFSCSMNLPPIIICEGDFMKVVRPGGIIMVQESDEGDKYVPILGETPIAEMN